MPFQKGSKRPSNAGRKKGSSNRRTMMVDEMVSKLNVDPLEVLLLFAKGDWKKLGYDAESTICYNSAGIEYTRLTISPETRIMGAKEAVKYIYSQKKAMELSASSNEGFKIIVQDFTINKGEKK
jgi:hypothetical protein